MIKINLIPPEFLAEQEKKLRILQAALAACVLALVVAGVSLWRWDTEHGMGVKREGLQAELNKVNEKVKQVDEFEKVLAAVQSHLDVINNLLKGRLLNPFFMEDFARALTGGIWVTSINTSASGNGLKLAVSAKALDKDQIAAWIRSLESFGNTVESATTVPTPPQGKGAPGKGGSAAPPAKPNRFSDIELGGIQAVTESGSQIFTFTLNCTYQNPKL
jgi:Tfp pilus assembly protein PilN